MSDAPVRRPRQATMAGWLIIGGSVLLVVAIFQRVAGLRSLETREAVQRFLSEPPGDELGLDVEGVLSLLHTLSLVAGGCAAAMAVLGYQALQRSKFARLALTVLAVPVFVTGLVAGGFLSSLVAAAAVMLWFQPSRDWFDGVRRSSVPARSPGPGAPPDRLGQQTPPSLPLHGSGSQDGPRPVPGFGAPAAQQQPGGAPYASGAPAPRPSAPRPSALTWACSLTWAFCGLAAAVMLLAAVVLAAAPDLVLDELRRQRPELVDDLPSTSALQQASLLAAGVTVVWCIAAAVLAALAYRGAGWARNALLVSAGAATLLCLVGSLQNALLALPALAGLAAVVLLLRPEVRAWYADRGTLRP